MTNRHKLAVKEVDDAAFTVKEKTFYILSDLLAAINKPNTLTIDDMRIIHADNFSVQCGHRFILLEVTVADKLNPTKFDVILDNHTTVSLEDFQYSVKDQPQRLDELAEAVGLYLKARIKNRPWIRLNDAALSVLDNA